MRFISKIKEYTAGSLSFKKKKKFVRAQEMLYDKPRYVYHE